MNKLPRTGGYIYECPDCKCKRCGQKKSEHTTEEMDWCLKTMDFKVKYQDSSPWGVFKRSIGIRDGYLICNNCKKDFFNLIPSEICYFCWCDLNDMDWDWH